MKRYLTATTLMQYERLRKRTQFEKRIDNLFQRLIFKRDHVCLRCGKQEDLLVFYIFGKENESLRWDPTNAFLMESLCLLEADEFAVKHIGFKRYDTLRVKAGFHFHRNQADLVYLERELNQKLKEVK